MNLDLEFSLSGQKVGHFTERIENRLFCIWMIMFYERALIQYTLWIRSISQPLIIEILFSLSLRSISACDRLMLAYFGFVRLSPILRHEVTSGWNQNKSIASLLKAWIFDQSLLPFSHGFDKLLCESKRHLGYCLTTFNSVDNDPFLPTSLTAAAGSSV